MSTFHYTAPLVRSSARLERFVLSLGLCLPVPLLAATGLSVPLPAVVERIAAALVPWAEAAALSEQPVERGPRGSIVLTRSELATPGARTVSVTTRVQPAPADAPRAVMTVPPQAPPASKGENRRPRERRERATPAPVARVPSRPARPTDTPKRGAAAKPKGSASHEPRATAAPAKPEPKRPEKQTPVAPAPAAPAAPEREPTVVDPFVETVATVDSEVDSVKEKTGEKVDRVVVTVDKTGEKVVGHGQNVVSEVDVSVQKLPKAPGG